MNSQPSKRSIQFMSKINWKELEPYMKKIYGEEFTKKLVKQLEED
jgi:hypothetical protein